MPYPGKTCARLYGSVIVGICGGGGTAGAVGAGTVAVGAVGVGTGNCGAWTGGS